jgi:hypothetical protein
MSEDPTVELSAPRLSALVWLSPRNRPHCEEAFALHARDGGAGAVTVNRGRWSDPPKPTRSKD